MKKVITLLFLVGIVLGSSSIYAQRSITISGVVMDADSVTAIPYVNIRLKDTFFGTISDNSGHFAFSASEGDTLLFSFVGYFDAYFVMPNDLKGNSYSLIQLMRKETIMLEEVVIFPWPEYDQLKKAFLDAELKPSLDDISIKAIKKIDRISQDEYLRNRNYYNVYHNNQLYDMTGIVPPNNFLNPLQWSNFIRDVMDKKYKSEKK